MSPSLPVYLPLSRRLEILKRAFLGESLFHVGVSLTVEGEDYLERKIHLTTALSPVDAVAQIVAVYPAGFEVTLSEVDAMVCVQRFIAHPCRAARWILFYRQMIGREREAMKAVLGVQAVKRAWKEIESGRVAGIGPVTANAQTTPAFPDDKASAPIARGNAVVREDHGGDLSDGTEADKSAIASPATGMLHPGMNQMATGPVFVPNQFNQP